MAHNMRDEMQRHTLTVLCCTYTQVALLSASLPLFVASIGERCHLERAWLATLRVILIHYTCAAHTQVASLSASLPLSMASIGKRRRLERTWLTTLRSIITHCACAAHTHR